MDYLIEASDLISPPFWFEETQKCISPPNSDVPLTRQWLSDLEGCLERIIYDHMEKMNTEKRFNSLAGQHCQYYDIILGPS